MKVLYCESGSGRGGSAISLLEFLQGCGPTEIEPSIACFSDDAMALFEPLGYPVHRLPLNDGVGRSAMRLWQVIRTAKPDLIHTNNDIYSHIGTILGARARGVPVVAHHRAVRDLTRAERLLWRRIRHHVAVSAYLRDQLLTQGVEEGSISVIYDAITLPRVERLDRSFAHRELGLHREVSLIGCIGSLRPEKGPEVLVAALRRLVDLPELHLIFIGGDFHKAEGYGERLEAQVASFGLADRVHFTGHQTDTVPWISSLKLLVFPTLLPEGFGRASLEAMACGVPVVASAIGAIPEVVQDGVTGYLVPPGESEPLARTIRAALTADNGPLVAQAIENAVTIFGLPNQVTRMLELYRSLLGDGPGDDPAWEGL